MSSEIHLPDIGADQAEVTEIFVKIGDVIEVETPLIAVEGDKAATLLKLMNALDDCDDVQNVYANFEISDEEMERLAD